jgi:hypothetical protein
LAEKCILRLFFDTPKKSSLQPARYEAFTIDEKTRHLYDTGDFSTGAASDHFLRNLLNINRMAWKSGCTEQRQNRVTYNNMSFVKHEKRGAIGGGLISQVTDNFKTCPTAVGYSDCWVAVFLIP